MFLVGVTCGGLLRFVLPSSITYLEYVERDEILKLRIAALKKVLLISSCDGRSCAMLFVSSHSLSVSVCLSLFSLSLSLSLLSLPLGRCIFAAGNGEVGAGQKSAHSGDETHHCRRQLKVSYSLLFNIPHVVLVGKGLFKKFSCFTLWTVECAFSFSSSDSATNQL